MIHDVDETLRALIERDVAGDGVDVSFDAPNKDWASRQGNPTINAFLYDIREDITRRDVAPRSVKDADGRVVERRSPMRRFRLSYLLTAWTQRPEDEHRLLAQLLSTFLRFDRLPDELLVGSLADAGIPTIITLALPPTQDRSLSDIWTAMGGELKPSLDLVAVAPVDPGRAFETGPPVVEEPGFTLSPLGGAAGAGSGADPADPPSSKKGRSSKAAAGKARSTKQASSGAGAAGSDDEEPGDVDLDEPRDGGSADFGGEEIHVGGKGAPGRGFIVRRK